MDRDNSQIFHTVVITGLKDPSRDKKVALALSRIIKNMPPDKILKRLQSLPWTLTRKATSKNATRLARYLSKVGTRTKVTPPLEASVLTDALETQILPDTHLLSQTQVMSTTQIMSATQIMSTTQEMSVQDDPPPQPKPSIPAPTPPPPPIEPGRRIQPLAVPAPKQTPPPPPPSGPSDESGLLIEPLTLGGMLDRTFQICRAHFWKLLAVIGVWWGIATLIGVLAIIVTAVAGLTYQSVGNVPLWLLITAGIVLVPVTVVVLIGLFYLSQGALIHAVSSIYLGREVRVGEAYSFALGRLRKLIFTYILVTFLMLGVLIAVGAAGTAVFFLFYAITSSSGWTILISLPFWLALVLVTVYVGLKLLLIDKVIIIEDLGYTDAIKRSWTLLAGKMDGPWPIRWYVIRLFALLILFILINMVVSLLFQIPGMLLMLLLPQTLASILNHILSNVGSVVASLFGAVCMVIFYYDLRNRKEGFDLEVLAGTREE